MGMRRMKLGYSFHWAAGHEPIFIRPDNKHVRLRVMGDIPYLTEALPIAVRGKGLKTYRALPAMPAPTVMCSSHARKWNRFMTSGECRESESQDESDGESGEDLRVQTRAGSCCMFK